MANKPTRDNYANKFYGSATESAANTLTFKEIPTNVNTFDKIAWVLHRLEWYIPKATWDLVINTADTLTCALTASSQITALGLDNPSVIDAYTVGNKEATAVGFSYWQMPQIRDFSGLPGGGLIMAPRPLYIGLKAESFTSAATAQLRGYFSQLSMSSDDYLELVDFYRIVS